MGLHIQKQINNIICSVIILVAVGIIIQIPIVYSYNKDSIIAHSGFSDEENSECLIKNSFDADYLQTHYPKAYVIREYFFSHMTPEQVDSALAAIITLLTEKPWFYFVDSPDEVSITLYWEHIIDQCSLISEFIKKARVNLSTHTVYLPEKLAGDSSGNYFGFSLGDSFYTQAAPLLITTWRKAGKTSVHDFYAFCFDMLIKVFNEGFLVKDRKKIQRYYQELEYVFGKLRTTKYESSYQENMKVCKELLALYKTNNPEQEALLKDEESNAFF